MARIPRDEPPIKGTPKPKWRRGTGNRRTMAADSQAEITRKQRRTKAFDLHCFGANWTRIGEELGISPKQARLDVERYASEIGKESNEQRRKVYSRMLMDDILTLNQAIAALRPLALARSPGDVPDVEASRTMAAHLRTKQKSIAELCLINGVRLPVVQKVEHTGELEVKHSNAEDVLGKLARITAARGAGSGDPEPVSH